MSVEDKIACFIKFGERKYMKSLYNGEFYFSNAKKFAEIEDELVRGQGDKLEGKAKVNATHMKMTDNDTGASFETKVGDFVTIGAETVKFKPVYCMTAFTCAETSMYEDAENFKIDFSTELKETIRRHFPKADTAVIFPNPARLINKMEEAYNTRLEHGLVKYFNMYPVGMDWVEFVNKKEKIEKGTKYSLSYNDAYKMLLCKDLYFKNEKEYRFILADDAILEPEVKPVNDVGEVHIMGLSDLFNNGYKKG